MLSTTNLETNSVNVKQFYGTSYFPNGISTTLVSNQINSKANKNLPHRLNNLCGPSQTWRVFSKQKEALEFAISKRGGLMTFAFQQSDGTRSFLVAHPQVFWHFDTQKNLSQRCSFEVIPESSACKLYFDLEYETKFNVIKNGPAVVHTFTELVLYFIKVLFHIDASRNNILDLDSSTPEKFSRHLIFQFQSHVFCNFKSVGEFVKFVCQKLNLFLNNCDEKVDSECSSFQGGPQHHCKCCHLPVLKNTGCIRDIKLSRNELEELYVFDKKANKHLICDLSVYSRNRHFRLYQNTKWSKHAPLVISEDNRYKPFFTSKKLLDEAVISESFFLDSLVSYFRFSQKGSNELLLLHFVNPLQQKCTLSDTGTHKDNISINTQSLPLLSSENSSVLYKSPYPDVDDFINSVVFPGRIWRVAYFSSSSTIVYDILGNRYCQHIKRQHRSNNVKYIVNIENLTYYQKCHDIDCSNYRSPPQPLPADIKFRLDDSCVISDLELIEVASVVEDLSYNQFEEIC